MTDILARYDDGLVVRTMTRQEAAMAVEWAAGEGWNPGLNDAGIFFDTDPGGFMLAERGGEPLGCISAVAYGDSYGFMGFYIVRPELRGQGIGGRLAQAGLERMGGRVIGLDGVVAQQENYKRAGAVAAFTSLRQRAAGGGVDPGGWVDLAGVPFEQVAALDRACFPAPREGFLRAWIGQPGAAALGMAGGEGLVAYGVMRPCRSGFKIGPLFALEPAAADTLFAALLARAPQGAEVFLDTPLNNPRAAELVKRHGLSPVFETARMYLNGQPPWNVEAVYGITSFELG